ncbi:MAG: tRNA (adenosine(37)-N6)-threonylcarbamoyltransferase complex ATPase subunit type 1 TsaE [Planctomycetaceae bacterium]
MSSGRHEFDYIAWIRSQIAANRRVLVGPGDDAALVRLPPPGDCLVTVDMLMEGVDFTIPSATPQQVGRKALAVNLSDIAAMAGRPRACVISVALPRAGGFELGCGLFEGLRPLADEFDVAIVGGDTNTWDGPLVVSITVLGEPTGSGPVLRSGAQPGDWIMATGSFGGSLAGKHLDFSPRVREALALHQAAALHALIDVSDGLAADLGHILDESRVGAILYEPAIPVSAAALAARDGRPPLDHALADGEDFELVFTVSSADGARLLAAPPFETPLSHIGEITADARRLLKKPDGRLVPLPEAGWKHGFEAGPGFAFDSNGESETERLGVALAGALAPGCVVGLIGPLGAGKTRLVRAVAQAAGVDPQAIASPTFVLVHEYEGAWPIYHVDAYRLHSLQEFLDLGAEEFMNSAGVCLIEWADRVAAAMPGDRLEVSIVPTGETSRRFRFESSGPRSEEVLRRLKSAL